MQNNDTIPAFNPVKFSFSEEPMGTDDFMKEVYEFCLNNTDKKDMPNA